MQTIALGIEGMTCGYCVATVAKAAQGVPGVESADVSLDRGQAVVHGAAVLIDAAKEQGYQAEVAA